MSAGHRRTARTSHPMAPTPQTHPVQLRARSYASRNQLAVSRAEVEAGIELEWDRRYTSVLGTAGGRLYSLRLQTQSKGADQVRASGAHEGVRGGAVGRGRAWGGAVGRGRAWGGRGTAGPWKPRHARIACAGRPRWRCAR
jgi:hypothetical protein